MKEKAKNGQNRWQSSMYAISIDCFKIEMNIPIKTTIYDAVFQK